MISEPNISENKKMVKLIEINVVFFALIATQRECSGWENNLERVTVAAFSR